MVSTRRGKKQEELKEEELRGKEMIEENGGNDVESDEDFPEEISFKKGKAESKRITKVQQENLKQIELNEKQRKRKRIENEEKLMEQNKKNKKKKKKIEKQDEENKYEENMDYSNMNMLPTELLLKAKEGYSHITTVAENDSSSQVVPNERKHIIFDDNEDEEDEDYVGGYRTTPEILKQKIHKKEKKMKSKKEGLFYVEVNNSNRTKHTRKINHKAVNFLNQTTKNRNPNEKRRTNLEISQRRRKHALNFVRK